MPLSYSLQRTPCCRSYQLQPYVIIFRQFTSFSRFLCEIEKSVWAHGITRISTCSMLCPFANFLFSLFRLNVKIKIRPSQPNNIHIFLVAWQTSSSLIFEITDSVVWLTALNLPFYHYTHKFLEFLVITGSTSSFGPITRLCQQKVYLWRIFQLWLYWSRSSVVWEVRQYIFIHKHPLFLLCLCTNHLQQNIMLLPV